MTPHARGHAVGLLCLTAVAVVAAIGVEPTILTAPSVVAGVESVPLQIVDTVIEILDRIADVLNQLNRVVSEFTQLFGEGGEGGD